MKKTLELTETLYFTGPGAQTDLTYTLPNSAQFDADVVGTDDSDQGAVLLGFGSWYLIGQGWKVITVQYHSSTTVRFVDNTGHIQLSQLSDGDVIKFTFKAHVN